jgi:uncharacterized protein (DUF1697 family)
MWKIGGGVEYIALLRGINVGGHTLKMDELRRHFVALGFGSVRTYIQSGNVFFQADIADRLALADTIERHLRAALGYGVPVCLRTVTELEQIIAADPFKRLIVTPDMRLCVMFTNAAIPRDLALPLRSPKGDMEIIATSEHEAFVVWYLKDGRPPAAYSFEEVLGKKTTTRFYHTTAKILEAAKKQS